MRKHRYSLTLIKLTYMLQCNSEVKTMLKKLFRYDTAIYSLVLLFTLYQVNHFLNVEVIYLQGLALSKLIYTVLSIAAIFLAIGVFYYFPVFIVLETFVLILTLKEIPYKRQQKLRFSFNFSPFVERRLHVKYAVFRC